MFTVAPPAILRGSFRPTSFQVDPKQPWFQRRQEFVDQRQIRRRSERRARLEFELEPFLVFQWRCTEEGHNQRMLTVRQPLDLEEEGEARRSCFCPFRVPLAPPSDRK